MTVILWDHMTILLVDHMTILVDHMTIVVDHMTILVDHLIMWESSLWKGNEPCHQPRPEPRGDVAHGVAPDSLG